MSMLQRRRALLAGALFAGTGLWSAAASATPATPAASASSVRETGSRGTVALVIQAGGPNAPTDQKIREHLESRGFLVNVLNQDVPASRVGNARLVILSSTIAAKSAGEGWRQLAVPLLTWENDLLDDLAMTGKRHDVDYGEAPRERYLWLVNAPHPVSAGMPTGAANVYQKQAAMSWGKPGLGASIIATLYGQPEKAAIFVYEKGATMDYESLAPARRVMFCLANDTFTNLSAPGLRLFDAAVDWAIAGH
ncbi:hypothetical protein [Cupriavidus sp. RAF12]|uniref:hypothetical protein n=1 Tax=Cupriavidus sp. RAF12 TaxID=3233050 RepID=UPI003F903356